LIASVCALAAQTVIVRSSPIRPGNDAPVPGVAYGLPTISSVWLRELLLLEFGRGALWMTSILAIEDNDGVREELVDILRFEGYEVSAAENGREGLELIPKVKPELIVCDMMMPEMDGYETLRRVRSDPNYSTIPFVCLTARVERGDMRRAMEAGADDYVTKPFTAEELIAAVHAGLGKRARAEHESEEKLSDLRKRLSTTLPHELRTPLSAILGFADMLLDPATIADPKTVVECAERIERSARRLYRLTENFLLFAELELLEQTQYRRISWLREPSAAAGYIDRTARKVAAGAHRDDDLIVHVVPASVCVTESYLGKLVEELVDNAFKFSKPGIPVRVESIIEGDDLVLRVSDRGVGMTPQQVQSIQAYAQFDRMMHEQQGIGLGLSIARRIATLCEGTLAIESEPGHGTTVMIRVPVAAAARAQDPATDGSEWLVPARKSA
jgi:two-component system sensor histidine kinase/response regulator